MKGNISAERVTLEDGAKFRGSIDMDLDEKPSASSYKVESQYKADKSSTTKELDPA